MEQFWNITTSGREAEIDIFGVIGDLSLFEESTSAADFTRELRGMRGVNRLNVNIHSPGGSINDGLAIYDAIRQFKAEKKVGYVPALAASMATVIALAVDELHVGPNATWAIHNPMGNLMDANADEMRHIAGLLDNAKLRLLNIYEIRTGQDRDHLSDLMDQEARFTGSEIKDFGWADVVMQDAPKRKMVACSLDLLNKWKNPPMPIEVKAELPPEIAERMEKVKLFKP